MSGTQFDPMHFNHLKNALSDAQKKREYFPGLEWIDYERLVMLCETNRLRKMYGEDLVTIKDIEKCESLASGHIDYTKKFSLYCSELI